MGSRRHTIGYRPVRDRGRPVTFRRAGSDMRRPGIDNHSVRPTKPAAKNNCHCEAAGRGNLLLPCWFFHKRNVRSPAVDRWQVFWFRGIVPGDCHGHKCPRNDSCFWRLVAPIRQSSYRHAEGGIQSLPYCFQKPFPRKVGKRLAFPELHPYNVFESEPSEPSQKAREPYVQDL